MVDTGADVTLLKEPIESVEIVKGSPATITGVTGEKKTIEGVQNLTLEVQGVRMDHPVWIADIQCEVAGILGMDVLSSMNAIVDLGAGRVTVSSVQKDGGGPLEEGNYNGD